MLGNLDPGLRSRLEAVHLVCLFKSTVLEKYSINDIMRPFVEDLKKLQEVLLFCYTVWLSLLIIFLAWNVREY